MKWEDYQSKATDFEFTFEDMGAYKDHNAIGYGVEVLSEGPNSASGYAFRVEVSDVPSEVCKRINNMKPTSVDAIEPNIWGCATESGAVNPMIFYFDENFKNMPPISSSSSSSSGSRSSGSGGSSGSSSSGSSSSSGGSSDPQLFCEIITFHDDTQDYRVCCEGAAPIQTATSYTCSGCTNCTKSYIR